MESTGFWLEIREHWRNRLLRSDKGRRIGKECVFETEDWFFSWKFERIGVIDFCEVTNEDVLVRNAYLKLKIGF
jgi:hypothetical protein